MATIKDIAKLLGLSVSTVSMALNDSPEIGEKTKEKVREAAKKLNYSKNGIAIDLQRQKTNIALVITDNPTRPFFTDSLQVLQSILSKHNLDVVIITANQQNHTTAERFISERRADAVICLSRFISDDFINTYANNKMKIVVIGGSNKLNKNENVINISLDYNRIGEEITDYLIQSGHKRIAFVKESITSIGSIYRFEGYLRALKRNQIAIDRDIIFDAKGGEYDHGYAITEKIAEKIITKKIDAIFYSDDNLAVGGLHKLLELGIKVPDDVSIVGYNNYLISKIVTPKITTVDLHQQKIMEFAAKALVSILEGTSTREYILNQLQDNKVLSSEIIERDSVKKR
jgi:LacI family transcriptional regulator